MNRDFKGIWIPKEIWLAEELTLQEKVFFVEIHSLDNERGCYANNEYFANFFGLSKVRVSEVINSLVEKGFIISEINSEEGNKRILKTLINFPLRPSQTFLEDPHKLSFKHNNTFNNTMNNNTSAKAEVEKKEKKVETVEERELRKSIFDFISTANKAIVAHGGVSEDPVKYYRQVKKLIEADERITVQVLKDTFNRYFAIRNGFAWRGKTKSLQQFMFSFQEIYQSINNNEENPTRPNATGASTIAEKRGFTDAVEILRQRKYAFTNSRLSPNDIGRQE
jgi:hypothetical protein